MPKKETCEISWVGNTETHEIKKQQEKQYIFYCFTLNNYTDTEIRDLEISINNNCKKAIVGKEVGKEGTPHLQGQLTFKKKTRITEIKKLPGFERAHIEKTNNVKASEKYCQKDGDILFKVGFPPEIKTISNLYEWQNELLTKLREKPDERKIIYIYEGEGNVGKSAFIKYILIKEIFKIGFCDGGKKSDVINMIYNLSYDPEVVFMDLPRENMGHISTGAIECIKNGMIFNSKFETGFKVFNSPHVVIFSNYEPACLNSLSMDRWDIYTIEDLKLVAA